QSSDITAESAMEFSENAEQMIGADYRDNSERLRTFVRIREMLDKTIAFYGLDPEHSSGQVVDRAALDEARLDDRLKERQRKLRDQLQALPERPGSSVQILDLERSRLVLSSWEKEALLQPSDSPEADLRLGSELLGRSAAVMAEINEAY